MHDQCIRPASVHCREGLIKLSETVDRDRLQRQTQTRRCSFQVRPTAPRCRVGFSVVKHYTRDLGSRLLKKLKCFFEYVSALVANPGDVAARMREPRTEAQSDRVLSSKHHYRDRIGLLTHGL